MYLLRFLLVGYPITIAIETPILLLGLSSRHHFSRRLFCGIWLTACTYPVVVLVLPVLIRDRSWYLLVAETFAPVAECALFWLAFGDSRELFRRSMWQDLGVIVLANLCSFGFGELLDYFDLWRRLV
jgi:hypothetical protein